MSGWGVFWICLAIVISEPSFGEIVKQLKRIADALEELARRTEG